jgi:hypothetical protein
MHAQSCHPQWLHFMTLIPASFYGDYPCPALPTMTEFQKYWTLRGFNCRRSWNIIRTLTLARKPWTEALMGCRTRYTLITRPVVHGFGNNCSTKGSMAATVEKQDDRNSLLLQVTTQSMRTSKSKRQQQKSSAPAARAHLGTKSRTPSTKS